MHYIIIIGAWCLIYSVHAAPSQRKEKLSSNARLSQGTLTLKSERGPGIYLKNTTCPR